MRIYALINGTWTQTGLDINGEVAGHVTVAIKNHHGQVSDAFAFGFSDPLQVVDVRRVDIDTTFDVWSDGDLFHVHTRTRIKHRPFLETAMTGNALPRPIAVNVVPSMGSTATSVSGFEPSPTASSLNDIGASSFSPSPITMIPLIGTVVGAGDQTEPGEQFCTAVVME